MVFDFGSSEPWLKSQVELREVKSKEEWRSCRAPFPLPKYLKASGCSLALTSHFRSGLVVVELRNLSCSRLSRTC